ncbi:hypothetical protein MXF25_23855, partial [Klebsiella aerogenes]
MINTRIDASGLQVLVRCIRPSLAPRFELLLAVLLFAGFVLTFPILLVVSLFAFFLTMKEKRDLKRDLKNGV